MSHEAKVQIKPINKALIQTQLIEALGSLLFGLGLYGKFGANGNAFHPALNNPDTVHLLLLVGVATMIWGTCRFISLLRKKASLRNTP